MEDSIVKLYQRCITCVDDVLVKLHEWTCDDLFRFPFLCQVVTDSVNIVDDVGDWPAEVVQEESNEWVVILNKSIYT